MSLMLYLASNSPLDTVENPHCKRLSVNEALKMGITDIPEHMLASDFDRDLPDVILCLILTLSSTPKTGPLMTADSMMTLKSTTWMNTMDRLTQKRSLRS